ncbi:MAG: outer membrane lipoprotein chaperone LolA [Mariprofundaceae bacterium]|nr:outer membrane lipoprotein chaperone LolA [Mariprofundaceae bacterium]
MKHLYSLLCLSIMLMPQAWADTIPKDLQSALTNMANMKGFSCHFDQTLMFSDGTEQAYQGELMIHRPNRFRWQYRMPYEQLFISDGTYLWHYEPDLMQVRQLNDMQEVDPAVMQLLAGKISVKDITLLKQQPQLKRYQVQIKNGTQVWLGLSEASLVDYAESSDALGNRNRIHFRNIVDKVPNKDQFIFHVPDGVELLHNSNK